MELNTFNSKNSGDKETLIDIDLECCKPISSPKILKKPNLFHENQNNY